MFFLKCVNLKKRIRKEHKSKTKYRNLLIMSFLMGALLIGGSITAFSNFGKNNNNNADRDAQTKRLISHLTNTSIPSAKALGFNSSSIDIVEFGDYQDPLSASFNNETKNELIANYIDPGIARFIFKDLIVNDSPQNTSSTFAAESSYCAADQNKYWEFHDELFNNSKGENTGWVSKESLIGFAKNAGVKNIEQFSTCLESHKYKQVVMNNDIFAKDLGFVSSPTFLIINSNSSKVAAFGGAQPFSVFKDTINQLLNKTI
jgi:protein-disulfide isomerase